MIAVGGPSLLLEVPGLMVSASVPALASLYNKPLLPTLLLVHDVYHSNREATDSTA